jgi:hypothetical protein
MIGQPRRNEDRFYRYPKRRVVAVIDDDAQLDAPVRELDRAGIDRAGVNVLSGPDPRLASPPRLQPDVCDLYRCEVAPVGIQNAGGGSHRLTP